MRHQTGFVLPLLLALLFVGGLLYHVNGDRLSQELDRARLERTRLALAEAREALIAHAITYDLMPEHAGNPRMALLPCPDLDGDGSADTCGSMGNAALGRLPYRTLALPRLLDGYGECLWYAVAGGIKNNPDPAQALNWDTPGQFLLTSHTGSPLITGTPARAVAVVLAPGGALAGQSRGVPAGACAGGANATTERIQFLEGSPAMASGASLTLREGDPHSDSNNDLIAWIRIDDIFDHAVRSPHFASYLQSVSDAIAANHHYLGFNALSGPPGSVAVVALPADGAAFIPADRQRRYADWREMFRYVGCVPIDGDMPQCLALNGAACQAILAFGGSRVAGQIRPSSGTLADYFEAATLAALTGPATAFSGPTDWNPSTPTADVLRCLN